MERDHSPVVDLTSGTVPGDTFVGVLLDYLSLVLTLHPANFAPNMGFTVTHVKQVGST